MTPVPVMPRGRTVGVCDSFAGLVGLSFSETVELALWQREVLPEIRDQFCNLDYSEFQDFRVDGDGARILSSAQAFLTDLSWTRCTVEFVMSDIAAIVGASSDQEADYTLRLEYVTDDACRKFHKDKTDIRLITTYLGRGTQWIETGSGIVEPVIREMGAFEMGIFLGERYGRQGQVFHRSPPIEGTGGRRFMMVLDVKRSGTC